MPIRKVKKILITITPKVIIIGKKHIKKIYLSLGALIVVGLLYSARGYFLSATVNGKPIYRWNLVDDLEKQYKKQVLENLIIKELINQETEAAAVFIPQELVLAKITELEKRIESQGTTLDVLLTSQGITREELAEQIELELKLEEMLKDKIEPSEEEVNEYLSENIEDIPNLTYDDAKEYLKQQNLNREIQSWIVEKKASSNIKYYGKYTEQTL